mmetsp:Transcript_28367/g.79748  ORF Transcript_28367/g.79748 Transcript_28367/m.79748 type:complete len:263 (-) Transcript_28367:253-1041(-)
MHNDPSINQYNPSIDQSINPCNNPQNTDYVRFEENKQMDLSALKRVRNNIQRLNPLKHCERGLETRMSRKALDRLIKRRFALLSSVLQEQYLQRQYQHQYYHNVMMMREQEAAEARQDDCERNEGDVDNQSADANAPISFPESHRRVYEEKLATIALQISFGPAMEAMERGIKYGLENMESSRADGTPITSTKRHKRSWSLELEYEDASSSEEGESCSNDNEQATSKTAATTTSMQQPKIPSWKQFLADVFQSAPVEVSVRQ